MQNDIHFLTKNQGVQQNQTDRANHLKKKRFGTLHSFILH